ncbi:MAG TPA: alpha/beta hydrolase [Steroidobacteraceae bacterium]|nr:alpha/beta hydrolase [Steroidobacteraceae bacterium]
MAKGIKLVRRILAAAALGVMTAVAQAQSASADASADEWAAHALNRYQVAANVTYLAASNYESKMDIYSRRGATTPQPTVVYFHGGFWAAGSKEGALFSLFPWMQMGWNVINVEYRLARVAQAPAAVEDGLCALRFLAANAKTYNIDVNRIVTYGESAGGHLALTSAMIPETAGLDRACAANAPVPRVAAVFNFYGVTDVADVIDGPHKATLAVTWMGSQPDRNELARRLSPLTYVRAGLPPIMTVHGDKDPTVPYEHAVKLHEALVKAGVQNQLLTIPGGGHGQFKPEERSRIFATVREFLTAHGLPASNP